MIKGGVGGANTNISGLKFEKKVDLKNTFSNLEGYLYDIVKKYQDKVVAFELNNSGFTGITVLLRGKIKYFMVRFNFTKKSIKRIYDDYMSKEFSEKVLITNMKEYERFQKILIVNNLKDVN